MAKKEKCKYWGKCFRKDKTHLKVFLHPGDPDPANDDTDSEAEDKAPAAAAPKGTSDVDGKTVVFTGTLLGCTRAVAEAKARDYGCRVTKGVSKATDFLVAGEDSGSKADRVKTMGVKIMTQAQWEKLLRDSPKASRPIRNTRQSSLNYDEDSEAEDKEEDKGTKTKRKVVRVSSDVTMIGGMEDKPAKKAAPQKRRMIHQMSQSDMEDSNDSDDDDAPSPAKKAKPEEKKEDEGEKKKVEAKKKPRVKCQYGKKCFRKNKDHRKEFCHPGDDDEAYAVEKMETDDDVDHSALPAPKNDLDDGESVTIEAKHQDYTIKRTGDTYYCTCYQWKMQTRAPNKRSCKHLKGHLGDRFEDKRCGPEVVAGSETITRGARHKAIKQVMLAQKWEEKNVDPTGWWISEKLDGVRAFWDGKAFYSRLGNEFIPPSWFIKGFPEDMTLDGELFGGRGKFQSTVSIVKTAGSGRWKDVKFNIFDAPSLTKSTFEERVATLSAYFKKNSAPYAHPLEHEKCTGVAQLKAELKKVELLGGEGLMIRKPKSMYEHCRSHTLLKIKTFHDAEAVVIGHEKGKGRNQFVCGALQCKMECGKKFKVGSGLKDADRRKPPKIGSIITYRFQEYTLDGIPRFPSYIGVRIDADGPKDAKLPPKPE